MVLLREHTAGFFDRHPGPDDIALAIEVADTTLNWDRHTKGSLYSRAGIREYWIVDILQRRLIVCEDPGPGEYRSVQIRDSANAGTVTVTAAGLFA